MIIASAYANLTAVERELAERVARAVCATAERERVRPLEVLARPINAHALGGNDGALLQRYTVQAAIYELVRDAGAATTLTIESMIAELWAVVHSNVDDYLADFTDGDRSEIDWSEVPREKLAAVKSVQVERFPDGRVKRKLEFWDKLQAIKQAPELIDRLPPSHRFKRLDFAATGQSVTLPATITDQEAASRYAQAIGDS